MVREHDPASEELGGILREMREELNLKREHVAEQVNIGLRQLTAIELGEKNPSVATLRRLIQYYGASADRIFYPELRNQDSLLEEAKRLLAACTPNQQALIIAFIRMLREKPNWGL